MTPIDLSSITWVPHPYRMNKDDLKKIINSHENLVITLDHPRGPLLWDYLEMIVKIKVQADSDHPKELCKFLKIELEDTDGNILIICLERIAGNQQFLLRDIIN